MKEQRKELKKKLKDEIGHKRSIFRGEGIKHTCIVVVIY